ncbi:MAG TPA: NAD-dependent malic enzyme, partial [Clostridiales bacterium]|nr:NAD-dependent malic enzyme [Clostridiales bacterium]
VFHDDQHGTAIVLGAALINALKVVGKKMNEVKIVINGAGSAGIAIGKFLLSLGAKNIVMCDKFGSLVKGKAEMNAAQAEMAEKTNAERLDGSLKDVMAGADVFIGVSAPNIVSEEMVKSMNKDAIVFPMANPTPEIMPELALKAGAAVVGSGRSDYPNQVNNVLAFPGIFRGALDARAKEITEEMKVAACLALAGLVKEKDLSSTNILPKAFEKGVAEAVAAAVKKAAL